jgi:hypothetical protein
MRELTREEIAELAEDFAPRIASVIVIEENEQGLRYQIRIHSVTGSPYAEHFEADLTEIGSARCHIEWSVGMPGSEHGRVLETDEPAQSARHPANRGYALQRAVMLAIDWARMCRQIVPTGALTTGVDDVAGALRDLGVEDLPPAARAALGEAERRLAALATLVAAFDATIPSIERSGEEAR